MIVIILEPISQVSVLVSLQTVAWCGSGNTWAWLSLIFLVYTQNVYYGKIIGQWVSLLG